MHQCSHKLGKGCTVYAREKNVHQRGKERQKMGEMQNQVSKTFCVAEKMQ